jgi:septal ring factor EnvC (AmiA/AmiB activator)
MICKEYNSKIYLASQKHFPDVDKEELKKIDDETEVTRETLTKLKEKNQSLQSDLRHVNTTLTDEELERQIQFYKSEVEKLHLNLKMWEEGTIERIPDQKVDQAEKDYEKQKLTYKKIKKISFDVVDSLCEGMEMKREEVVKHIQGFEFDTEAFALLKNKQI